MKRSRDCYEENEYGGKESHSTLRKFSRFIKYLLIIQIWFYFMLPTLDSFLDLGDDIHDLVKHLYLDTKRARIGAFNKIVDSSSSQINTVCVPGAGFSGFWYSIGRLHAMKANKSIQQYKCFSAGCLGAVVNVLNHTIDDVLGIALEAQQLFFSGSIDRYEVVEFFIDAILKLNKDEKFQFTNNTDYSGEVEWIEELTNINILTTGSNGKYHSRQAQSFIELKTLLMQTTWIPYVTGRSMWRGNHENFDDLLHMDGAFTIHTHPRCDGVKLGLPLKWKLWRSILSPSLDKDKALEFYKYGISML